MTSEKQPILEIPNLMKELFVSRPNRFVGEIKYKGKIESAHIHDPGRLKELLIEGAEVLFTHSRGKLKYYIKAVYDDDEWVLIDTALHSNIAQKVFELLPEFSKVKEIRREVKLGNSRIDFLLDDVPLEVKGVTLVKEGIALFPDAPTERGARHVREIIEHNGIIFFLIFRKARCFSPNLEMDPKFSKNLSEARKKGIKILAVQISFDGKTVYYEGKVDLMLF
ncbi:MAG: DNA/RNA nuclease SfsA [Promethearchaeota archaeon Loki_b32]|nr:MAG: DNA/RNA nuclease SfsA [Candidatus Lokiarchaeota archaeon Loki_b32]